jgi:hypothetical protein
MEACNEWAKVFQQGPPFVYEVHHETVRNVGSFGHFTFTGADFFPGEANPLCYAPYLATVSLAVDENQKLLFVNELFNVTNYVPYENFCMKSGSPSIYPSLHAKTTHAASEQPKDDNNMSTAQFAKLLLEYIFTNNDTIFQYLAPDFTLVDGVGTPAGNATALKAAMESAVSGAPEAIVPEYYIVDQDVASGDLYARISGPSMMVVQDPLTTFPCLVPFQEDITFGFSGNSKMIKSIYFMYQMETLKSSLEKCHFKNMPPSSFHSI